MPRPKLVPRERPPLPGGPRYSEWEIASPGGISGGLIGVVGVNLFVIKNSKTGEIRNCVQTGGGVGGGLGLSGRKLVQIIVALISAGQFPDSMTLEFFDGGTTIFARRPGPPFPVTREEVEGCLVRVASAGAGLGKGVSLPWLGFRGAAPIITARRTCRSKKRWICGKSTSRERITRLEPMPRNSWDR